MQLTCDNTSPLRFPSSHTHTSGTGSTRHPNKCGSFCTLRCPENLFSKFRDLKIERIGFVLSFKSVLNRTSTTHSKILEHRTNAENCHAICSAPRFYCDNSSNRNSKIRHKLTRRQARTPLSAPTTSRFKSVPQIYYSFVQSHNAASNPAVHKIFVLTLL